MQLKRVYLGNSMMEYAIPTAVFVLTLAAVLVAGSDRLLAFFSDTMNGDQNGSQVAVKAYGSPVISSAMQDRIDSLPPLQTGQQQVCTDAFCINVPTINDNTVVETTGGNGTDLVKQMSDSLLQLVEQLEEEGADPDVIAMIQRLANEGHGLADIMAVLKQNSDASAAHDQMMAQQAAQVAQLEAEAQAKNGASTNMKIENLRLEISKENQKRCTGRGSWQCKRKKDQRLNELKAQLQAEVQSSGVTTNEALENKKIQLVMLQEELSKCSGRNSWQCKRRKQQQIDSLQAEIGASGTDPNLTITRLNNQLYEVMNKRCTGRGSWQCKRRKDQQVNSLTAELELAVAASGTSDPAAQKAYEDALAAMQSMQTQSANLQAKVGESRYQIDLTEFLEAKDALKGIMDTRPDIAAEMDAVMAVIEYESRQIEQISRGAASGKDVTLNEVSETRDSSNDICSQIRSSRRRQRCYRREGNGDWQR